MSDALPQEIVSKYIERRKIDLEACAKALAGHDFETLIRVGHQVKGNAITFGFNDLGLVAVELEECALRKDIAGVTVALKRFSEAVNKMKI